MPKIADQLYEILAAAAAGRKPHEAALQEA